MAHVAAYSQDSFVYEMSCEAESREISTNLSSTRGHSTLGQNGIEQTAGPQAQQGSSGCHVKPSQGPLETIVIHTILAVFEIIVVQDCCCCYCYDYHHHHHHHHHQHRHQHFCCCKCFKLCIYIYNTLSVGRSSLRSRRAEREPDAESCGEPVAPTLIIVEILPKQRAVIQVRPDCYTWGTAGNTRQSIASILNRGSFWQRS